MIIPPLDLPTIESTNPSTAKGMFSQFNQPNKGINPKSIPIKERIPKIRPTVFIKSYLDILPTHFIRVFQLPREKGLVTYYC